MRKYFLFVPALAFVICMSVTRADAQLVPWQPGIQLSWDDFTATPTNNFAAYTAYWLSYKYRWDGDGTLTITVQCSLDKSKTWKRPDRNLTPALLKHEQLHLDIAEVYARKMRMAFNNYASFHKYSSSTPADLKVIFDRLLVEAQAYNDKYDAETNHSLIVTKQEQWNSKIKQELNALDPYALR